MTGFNSYYVMEVSKCQSLKTYPYKPQCSSQTQVAKLDQAGDEVRQLFQQSLVQEIHLGDHNGHYL